MLAATFIHAAAFPQISETATVATDTLRKEALNVYMQSATGHIRREIPFINYVRDIGEAQLVIITTVDHTGASGMRTSYFLEGQNDLKGMNDTILVISSPDDTEDRIRERQVRALKMGLMRYVMKTPLAGYINISFTEPMTGMVAGDPWNNWVFRTELSGSYNRDATYKTTELSGRITSSRVTAGWKLWTTGSYSYSFTDFNINGESITSDRRSGNIYSMAVRSIGDHLALGATTNISTSTYTNSRLAVNVNPAIEFDLFPYNESTRRQLTILYGAGYWYQNYRDTTIYNRIRENLLGQNLLVVYQVVQKWGTVTLLGGWRNYFHDWSKNHAGLDVNLDLRIAKGLNLTFAAGGSMIHDQLSLVKGGASQEEILLRLTQIATQYSFNTRIGLTYTFGSIYTNVVNPRFDNAWMVLN